MRGVRLSVYHFLISDSLSFSLHFEQNPATESNPVPPQYEQSSFGVIPGDSLKKSLITFNISKKSLL